MEVEELFSIQEKSYVKEDGEFFIVNSKLGSVTKVDFEKLLFDYVVGSKMKLFQEFILIYIRLMMKVVGFFKDAIEDEDDIRAIAELYFDIGVKLKDNDND